MVNEKARGSGPAPSSSNALKLLFLRFSFRALRAVAFRTGAFAVATAFRPACTAIAAFRPAESTVATRPGRFARLAFGAGTRTRSVSAAFRTAETAIGTFRTPHARRAIALRPAPLPHLTHLAACLFDLR